MRHFFMSNATTSPRHSNLLCDLGWISLPVEHVFLSREGEQNSTLTPLLYQQHGAPPETQFNYPLISLSETLSHQREGQHVIVRPQVIQLLQKIIDRRQLVPFFQAIFSTELGQIIGFESLIRGPKNSPFHLPNALFSAARAAGLNKEMELLAIEMSLEAFSRFKFTQRLFLNVSPDIFTSDEFYHCLELNKLRRLGLSAKQIVIEITENDANADYVAIKKTIQELYKLGFQTAIDDLGEGFASFKMWLEIRPHYIKIDRYFIENIHQDAMKLEVVRSIKNIAEQSQCQVIAEGIETESEWIILRDLGIHLLQGFLISRPVKIPLHTPAPMLMHLVKKHNIGIFPQMRLSHFDEYLIAGALAVCVPPVYVETNNETVHHLFMNNTEWHAIAVIDHANRPIGLIQRQRIIDEFSLPFRRDLFARRPCAELMDNDPLIVDAQLDLETLSQQIALDRRYLTNGFIITQDGLYWGIGTGQDLMRELTRHQIRAARYANPLTMLPGNVPINEHMMRLIERQVDFTACYCDLDHFKPFNDVYGYRKGDDLIQLTAHVLGQICNPRSDFLGHIGGDDFIILFQSADWEARCQSLLQNFESELKKLLDPKDLAQGGIFAEDRRGAGGYIIHRFPSISIGAVHVPPLTFQSPHEIASRAAEAKHHAKQIQGNSLYKL